MARNPWTIYRERSHIDDAQLKSIVKIVKMLPEGTTVSAAKLKQVLTADEQEDLADGGEISTEDILAAQMAEKADDSGITYIALNSVSVEFAALVHAFVIRFFISCLILFSFLSL